MNRAWVLLAAGTVLFTNFMLAQSAPVPPPANKPSPAKPAGTVLKLPVVSKAAATPASAPKAAATPASKTPAGAMKTSAAQPAAAVANTPAAPLRPASMVQPVQNGQPSSLAPGSSQYPAGAANNYTGAPNSYAGTSPASPGTNNYANPASRSQASAPGASVGSFTWPGGWTLTSYGCFRADTRLFCDFDTYNPSNQQANTAIWSGAGGVNLVDDGGKITQRSTAFFVGTDGSTFQTAYISQQPVRFVIEYDNVNPRITSVSLVLTNNRIQSVPVRAMDPSQPAGTIPAR